MKKIILSIVFYSVSLSSIFAIGNLNTKAAKVSFFSHTKIEDIKADNFNTTCYINLTTGEVKISVPMQSFNFEKALMQKHFNQKKFLHTQKYPKAKFIGRMADVNKINLSRDGIYSAALTGELTIRGITQKVFDRITFKVDVAQGKVEVKIKTDVILADYGILFKKGKPSTNIAKTVKTQILAKYKI